MDDASQGWTVAAREAFKAAAEVPGTRNVVLTSSKLLSALGKLRSAHRLPPAGQQTGTQGSGEAHGSGIQYCCRPRAGYTYSRSRARTYARVARADSICECII